MYPKCTPTRSPPDTRHGPPGHWIPDAGWAPWCTPDCPPVLKRRPDRGWGDTDDAPRTENLTKLNEYSIPCIRPACIRVQLAGGLRDSNGPSLLVLTGHPTPTRLRAHQLSPKKKRKKDDVAMVFRRHWDFQHISLFNPPFPNSSNPIHACLGAAPRASGHLADEGRWTRQGNVLSMPPSITGPQTPGARVGTRRTARGAAVPGMFTRLGVGRVAFDNVH